MIRTIDIRLNAAHPELPLPEATTYQGAPSTAFLRGVPKACGQWQITAVNVAATFPDGSTTTRAAVLSAGDVWVATIPACATSGRTTSGLRILADGLDENGDAVTGFVLGVADFAVATFDIAPAPGVTSYALRYFDNVPNPAHKGDVTKVDGALKFYDGTAWIDFADVDLSNYATKADATLTPVFDPDPTKAKWVCSPAQMTGEEPYSVAWREVGMNAWNWVLSGGDGSQSLPQEAGDSNAGEVTFWIPSYGIGQMEVEYVTATRVPVGNRLGPDNEANPNRDKLLASEAEAEALRQGKYEKPSGGIPKSDLASAVQNSLDKADAALPKSGGTMSGNLAFGNYALQPNGRIYIGTSQTEGDILLPSDTGTLALVSQLPASETWTFEVDDGQGGTTTVTKNVAIYAGGNA